jgi:signal transduction histidine kinase
MRSLKNNFRRSLRMRLMAAYAAGMLLTATLFILIFVTAFFWQFDLIMYRGLKHNATTVAEKLTFDSEGKPQKIWIPKPVQWLYDELPNDVEFRVVDAQGNAVPTPQQTPRFLPRFLPTSLGPPSVDAPVHFQIDGRAMQVVAVPVLQSGGAYYLQAAASDRLLQVAALSLRRPIPDSIMTMVIISVPALGGLMLFVLSRLLRPLKSVSEEASRIDPRNLSARLSTQTVPSELAPLIDSFNLALERLEEGFRKQQQFLGSAAHELKTPLALMRGQIEVEGLADRATLLGDIDVMTRQVQQLLHLAEVSEIRNYKRESIDVHDLLADVVAFLTRMADRRGVRLHLGQAGKSVIWNGDKSAMFSLVKNLIENAIQHSPEGGMVTLLVEQRAVLSVRDQGRGIAREDVPRVFERFWRGPDRANAPPVGAGLGMSICEEIALAHGWRIEIDHAVPGTVFRVVNPELT